MSNDQHVISNRRNLLKTGLATAGAVSVGAALLDTNTPASAQSSSLTEGDIATLQFLAAGELLEVDFWSQYNELGGIQDSEVPGGSGNFFYTERLRASTSYLIWDNGAISSAAYTTSLKCRPVPTSSLRPMREGLLRISIP
jgi:hypothetical protein